MRSVSALVLAAGLVAIAGSVDRAPATVFQGTSRVVDLTVSCSVPVRAGIRELELRANSGVRLREDRSKWLRLTGASVSVPSGESVGLSAGAPLAAERGRTDDGTRLYANGACPLVRARVPLSLRGLVGGTAGQLDDEWDCAVSSRVIVRVRAIFTRPTRVRSKRYGVPGRSWTARVAAGAIERGWLAVRTPGGRQIAYADVNGSGRARLFAARACVPD